METVIYDPSLVLLLKWWGYELSLLTVMLVFSFIAMIAFFIDVSEGEDYLISKNSSTYGKISSFIFIISLIALITLPHSKEEIIKNYLGKQIREQNIEMTVKEFNHTVQDYLSVY